jgi:hypothetical protein
MPVLCINLMAFLPGMSSADEVLKRPMAVRQWSRAARFAEWLLVLEIVLIVGIPGVRILRQALSRIGGGRPELARSALFP